MQGIHLAYRVSIKVSSNGSFRCTVCERKLVSMRMLGWVSLGGERGERIGEGRYLLVGRHESSVVLEEERGGYLRSVIVSVYLSMEGEWAGSWRAGGEGRECIHFSHDLAALVCFLGPFLAFVLVLLQPCIVLPNDPFDLAMLECGVGREASLRGMVSGTHSTKLAGFLCGSHIEADVCIAVSNSEAGYALSMLRCGSSCAGSASLGVEALFNFYFSTFFHEKTKIGFCRSLPPSRRSLPLRHWDNH